jgi:hypothetical protein
MERQDNNNINVFNHVVDEDNIIIWVDYKQAGKKAMTSVKLDEKFDFIESEFKNQYLADLLMDRHEDINRLPDIADAHPITRYCVEGVHENDSSMFFIEKDPDLVEAMEDELGKSWPELQKDLEEDIDKFHLETLIEVLGDDTLATCYGNLQCAFSEKINEKELEAPDLEESSEFRYTKEQMVDAMAAAHYEVDEIESDDNNIRFDGEGSHISFNSWDDCADWLDGVVFDDPEISDNVEKVLHPERFENEQADEVTVLAKELDQFAYDYDYYGYMDALSEAGDTISETRDKGVQITKDMLLNGDIDTARHYLDEAIDPANDSDNEMVIEAKRIKKHLDSALSAGIIHDRDKVKLQPEPAEIKRSLKVDHTQKQDDERSR